MIKDDEDYKIMDFLDVPVGNRFPILQYRAAKIRNLNENNLNFDEIKKDYSVFSDAYKDILTYYSKFNILPEYVKENHGRYIIEACKRLIENIKEPSNLLKEMINKQENSRVIKELGEKLYNLSASLQKESSNFRKLPYFNEFRKLKFRK
ncbi:MAG: hypothetical protein PHH54_05120 [Candidatus Nanoarchaeia archaeon]|nr:hypothetical protein [Candidatus Nanoarchaeia archaeon]MDD5741339.1 hypothetical protein [Candidatus Nanoarchaeia archaeon]